ncbi:ATP-binding protein [Sphingomonas sp. DT-51]|uniref:ATP-binding protein n=1 Tax=Sphingomonas sp. DT-51 TaxID=3396165 RepID=UPI003F1D0DBB
MLELFQQMLAERGLPPHGYCLLWDPALIWTHAVSDVLIGLSYFSIPIVIARFLTHRSDVQFSWVIWMFAAFIMACGTTHFFSILTLWIPAYGIEGLIKVITAVVSVITATALWPLLPRALALPSPAQLSAANAELNSLVEQRDRAYVDLQRASEERQFAQDMLRQSQKMEAVGQLTSGVAHDFNNLLTVVIANLDRAERLLGDAPRAKIAITSALEGAEQASKLVDQLLSFARKQPLQNTACDLNSIVLDTSNLVERTIGEKATVQYDLEPNLPFVSIDLNQAQNAILNLVVNARDAVSPGGHITIKTWHDHRRLVLLSVTDDGEGMPSEVADRAFEPFFTMKEPGKGTGLGLSQVYGFARQSLGDVTITTELGSGTTVCIQFPATNPES